MSFQKENTKTRTLKSKHKVYKPISINNINMPPGDPKGLPDESFFNERTLVFIDEAFLSKLSKYFGRGRYLKFDRFSFAKNLAKKQKLICNKVFLYIAPPYQNPLPLLEDEKRKGGYDNFVRQLKNKGISVREGRCQKLKVNGEIVYKQKAVDVLLAMDLTNVPLGFPDIKKIILISSDSDFVPVIKNLEEKEVKTILYTYYEKKRDSPFSRSNHLIKSVYKYVLLTKEYFDNAPLKKRDKK